MGCVCVCLCVTLVYCGQMTNVIALVLGARIDTEDSYFVLDAGPGPPTHGSKGALTP